MKIEIEVDDISLFAKALNNACISYGDVVWGIFMGCEVQEKYRPIKELPEEELQARFHCLKNVYKQIEDMEKNKSKKIY